MEKIGYSSVESKDSEEILSLKEIREKLKNLKEDVLKKKLSKKEEEGKMKKQMVMGKVIKIAKEAAHNLKEGKKKANREKLLDSIESDSKESEYLKKYQKISYLEYSLMFPSLEEFWQGRLGDCYLISTIQSLARTRYFNTLMMTSIHVSKDWEYSITLPLWEPWWKRYNISREELKISAVKWGTGFKLLEVAFAKHLLHKDPGKKLKEEDIKKIEWWIPSEALQTLLWPKSITVAKYRAKQRGKSLLSLSEKNKLSMMKILEDFSQRKGNKYISLGSLPWGNDTKKYKIGAHTFYHRHAYSVTWVEKDVNWKISAIKVLNPRNHKGVEWWAEQTLNLSEFFNAFSLFDSGTITDTFLDHRTSKEETMVVDWGAMRRRRDKKYA